MEATFDALGDPTRRRILEILARGEQPAGAVVDALQAKQRISQPAVSQHLKTLREAGLVTVRADSTRRFYAVDHDVVHAARTWLSDIAGPDTFAQPLDALATEVVRGKRQRKQGRPESASPSAQAR